LLHQAVGLKSVPFHRDTINPVCQGFAFWQSGTSTKALQSLLTVTQRAKAKHLTDICSFLAKAHALSSWKVSKLTFAKPFPGLR
jgi:hypothetical protein